VETELENDRAFSDVSGSTLGDRAFELLTRYDGKNREKEWAKALF